ncbi:MAG: hypothetical protein D4R97_05770 [Bacteroidetes bacterium]|nr:MAG: hypothetical protein D4R97_05770 [Bacteroidota bacterium]
MNPQQFSELVKDPGSLREETITELEDLMKQYPYCTTAQVLLTLNMLQQKHPSYQAQLKRAVAYAGDRKKLKELLEGRKQKTETASYPVLQETPPEAVHQEEIQAPESAEEPESIAEVSDSITQAVQATASLQENYIEDSVISAGELALTTPMAQEEKTEAVGVIAPLSSFGKASRAQTEKLTQDELLSIVRKRLAEINEEKRHQDTKPGAAFDSKEHLKWEQASKSVSESNRFKTELIEKFMREEPQISRPKKEFFSPTASSQRSNMDEEDIVSETLAILYAKQGNMQKAIHIYEKLSLRFSEKSRYFAAQIENLKGNATQAS